MSGRSRLSRRSGHSPNQTPPLRLVPRKKPPPKFCSWRTTPRIDTGRPVCGWTKLLFIAPVEGVMASVRCSGLVP